MNIACWPDMTDKTAQFSSFRVRHGCPTVRLPENPEHLTNCTPGNNGLDAHIIKQSSVSSGYGRIVRNIHASIWPQNANLAVYLGVEVHIVQDDCVCTHLRRALNY